jgi:competence protein ComFC
MTPILLARTGAFVSRWMFPGRCAVCGRPLFDFPVSAVPICPPCEERLDFAPEDRCRVCGRELISEIGICMGCRSKEYSFDSNFPLFPYRSVYRDLIRRYKFGGMTELAAFFSARLASAYRKHFDGEPIVPVPFRKAKIKKTGWDQVDIIARRLRYRYSIPVMFMLERLQSRPQKELSYEDRVRNLRSRIILRRGAPAVPKSLILIDDVFTTGATLSECARALKEGGGSRVRALTICYD